MSSLRASIERRLKKLEFLRTSRDLSLISLELELCRRDPVHWFNNWVWTYDPRNAGSEVPTWLPLDLFPRQEELVRYLVELVKARKDGLVEKSRDVGFTWVAGGFALHRWLFEPGFKTTFGSRKEEYVDKVGEPDSIFEKIRMIRRGLPSWMLPKGFNDAKHDNYMRLIHPHHDGTIRGEAGKDIGRGGRSSLLIIDEAAHIENGDSIDAASSGNTDVRLWASSVNGMNFFGKKRHGGTIPPERIFTYHYTDDPRKTLEWAAGKKATMEPHIWAAEYELDYAASVEGICIPSAWVMAAIELGAVLDVQPDKRGIAGLDIGAGGKSKSVFIARFGPVVKVPIAWSTPDTIETANKALDYVVKAEFTRADGFECKVGALHFDAPGVGVGVSSALKYNKVQGLMTYGINTGERPTETKWPDGKTSRDKFTNLKAEIWFLARERFKSSYEMLLHLKGEPGGQEHPHSALIILPKLSEGTSVQQLVAQISMPRWFRNEKGLVLLESKIELSKRGIDSPDLADALMLTFARMSNFSTWERLGT